MSTTVSPSVVGIDPGIKGGLGFISIETGKVIHTCDIPIVQHTKAKKLVNASAVAELFREYNVTHAIIEDVNTMPGQGIASSGTFMKAVGTLFGVAAGHGAVILWVRPTQWKKHYGLPGKDKEPARAMAIDLFPEAAGDMKFKKDADKAEGLLLARYALTVRMNCLLKLLPPSSGATVDAL